MSRSRPETVIASGAPGSQTIDQTFRVSSDLGFPWLPVAYPPQQIEVPGTSVRFNDDTGTATVDSNLDAGTGYHVTSVAQQPTPEQLATEVFPPPAQDPRYTTLSGLPADVAAGIHQIAEAWTADATNDYERVLAIQDHLSDTSVFTYDQTVPARDDSYTLLNFLVPDAAGLLSAIRERHGHHGALARIPVPRRRRVHARDVRRRHPRVARDHEGRPQLGRSAIPDLRVAFLRAHARVGPTPSPRYTSTRPSSARRVVPGVRRPEPQAVQRSPEPSGPPGTCHISFDPSRSQTGGGAHPLPPISVAGDRGTRSPPIGIVASCSAWRSWSRSRSRPFARSGDGHTSCVPVTPHER